MPKEIFQRNKSRSNRIAIVLSSRRLHRQLGQFGYSRFVSIYTRDVEFTFDAASYLKRTLRIINSVSYSEQPGDATPLHIRHGLIAAFSHHLLTAPQVRLVIDFSRFVFCRYTRSHRFYRTDINFAGSEVRRLLTPGLEERRSAIGAFGDIREERE